VGNLGGKGLTAGLDTGVGVTGVGNGWGGDVQAVSQAVNPMSDPIVPFMNLALNVV
jgi:hypothetical protein